MTFFSARHYFFLVGKVCFSRNCFMTIFLFLLLVECCWLEVFLTSFFCYNCLIKHIKANETSTTTVYFHIFLIGQNKLILIFSLDWRSAKTGSNGEARNRYWISERIPRAPLGNIKWCAFVVRFSRIKCAGSFFWERYIEYQNYGWREIYSHWAFGVPDDNQLWLNYRLIFLEISRLKLL